MGDFGDSNVLERSVSRMTNESFGSITLQDYSKTEKSQENSSDELESDQDISLGSDSGSEWVPTELDEMEREREMSDNKNISIKKKQSINRKKKSNNTNTEEIQSPKRINPPSSHIPS